MTKALVTGGAGFIGNALVRRILEAGYEVRVLDDFSRGVPRRLADLKNKIELVQGSVCDMEAVDRATEGMDIVFHLAAVNGTENFYHHPDRVLEVAVKGTMFTMDAALRHKCKRYLLASSSEVYQQPTKVPTDETERIIVPDVLNPRFSYSGGKIIGELLALHYLARKGVETIVFRPHNIYGPDMGNEHVIPQFIARLRALTKENRKEPLQFPIQGDGSQTRAFCFVSDSADALLLLAEKGKSGEIYHIGREEEITIADLAQKIAKAMGLTISLVPGEAPAGGTTRRIPNIEKLRSLGFTPKVGLDEGIALTCKEEVRLLDQEGL